MSLKKKKKVVIISVHGATEQEKKNYKKPETGL
jgi:uncharacterized DUF497 family protein